MLRPLLLSLIAIIGISAAGTTAEAGFPGYGAGCFGPRGGFSGFGITNFGGYGGFGYTTGDIPAPPYFSVFPPVYYSYPVARPYGVSPFAIGAYQPSQRFVYQSPTPEPQVVVNPYATTDAAVAEEAAEAGVVEPATDAADEPTVDAAASYWPTPQVVINPFVDANAVVPVSFTKIVTP